MKSKQVLGKGLGALIPGALTEETKQGSETQDQQTGIISKIPIEAIEPNPYQPRIDFNQTSLQELANSIKENGVIQPITVHKISHDRYQLISGERRLRASFLAGLDFIPAYIIEVHSKEELIELSLIENIQRDTLNPIEIALGFKKLIDECNLSLDDISKKTGKDKSTISNFIRLLKLPEEIQQSIMSGEITQGHARALINIENRQDQINLWKKIISEKISVRETERLANQQKKKVKTLVSKSLTFDPNLEEIISKLRIKFGTNIKIKRNGDGSGEFQILFYSNDEFERILEMLNNVQ